MSALIACPSDVKVVLVDSVFDHRSISRLEAPSGRRLLEYIPAEWRDVPGLVFVRNGKALAGAELGEIARPGDELTAYVVPGEPGSILLFVVVSLVLTGVSYGISALTAPSARTGRQGQEESGTFGFDGIVNTVRPGTRIPIVYGEHRVGGHIIQQFLKQVTRIEENKSDVDVGELNTLICPCSGPIESIDSIRLDANPITDFQDVVFETRLGGYLQSAISGFQDVRIQRSKDTILRASDPPSTFTTDSEVDTFEVIFRFSRGLFKLNSGGGFSNKSVELEIEYRELGTEPWILAGRKKVTAKRQNPVDSWFRSQPLERARYEIRLRRITLDDNTAASVSECTVLTVNEILDEALTYPGLALLGVAQLPNNQFSGRAPTIDAMVKGRLVRVYTDEVNYTVQWSDNPAWCLLDFFTDSVWGLGKWFPRNKMLLDTFLTWSAECDKMVPKDSGGELEKQFRLDLVIDGSLVAIDAIKQITAAGRAVPFKRGDKWGVKFLGPEEPVALFTMGRINRGSFSATRQSRADIANVLSGEFWNRELEFEQDFLPVPDQTVDPEDEQVESSVNLQGTTRLSQANRLLNHYMLSNRLELRRCELEVGVEGLHCEAGDVVAIAHDVPGWGFSGKLMGVDASLTQLTLDREVVLENGKSYELTAIHSTDKIDVLGVLGNAGPTRVITVTGDWSSPPKAGTDYSFGELNRSTVKYRIRKISRSSTLGRRKISAQEYNPDVFGVDLSVLPPASFSRLPNPDRIPPAVINLRGFERIETAIDGTLSAALDVHFTLPNEAGVRAQVYWRELGTGLWAAADNPVDVGRFSIRDPDLTTGATYEISVVTVSLNGRRKSADQGERVNITTFGSTRQPEKVADFRGDRTPTGLIFSWQALDEAINHDLDFYELRVGLVWETAQHLGQTRDTTFSTGMVAKGQQTFLIKGRNTLGNYSAQAAAIILDVEGRLGENIILTRNEATAWTGVKDNFTVSAGKLILAPQGTLVGWVAKPQDVGVGGSQLVPGGRGTVFLLRGIYTTATFQVTSGSAVRSLVAADLTVNQIDSSAFWTAPGIGEQSWISEYGKQRAWAVAPEGRVRWRVEMRFSTTGSNEGDFGAWQVRAQNIEAAVKWAQARLTVDIADPAFSVEIVKMDLLFDVPEFTTSGTKTSSNSGTVHADFMITFNQTPKVTLNVPGATAGDEIFRTNTDNTGFDLEIKNAGARVVRTVDWIASGF